MTPERKKVWLRIFMRCVLAFSLTGLVTALMIGPWHVVALFVVATFSTGMWFGTQDEGEGRPAPRVRQR